MATLQIALNDGFAGDAVSVRLDGRRVYAKDQVNTDLRISRADEFEAEASEHGATIEVSARGQSASAAVNPTERPYVAINIDPQGKLEIRQSGEPFPML